MAFELRDAFAEPVVVGPKLCRSLLQLVKSRSEGPATCHVGVCTELASQPLAQEHDLLVETADLVLGVGQFGAQALRRDEGASREPPGSIPAGLALAVTGRDDATCQFGVGVEEGDRHPRPSGHGRETDWLANGLEGGDGLQRPLMLDAAILASSAPQDVTVVSHDRSCAGRRRRAPTDAPCAA